MVLELSRSSGLPVWHIDVIKTLPDTLDISLIRDEANELAPNIGPYIEVQQLGENQAAMVDQAPMTNPNTSEHTITTPFESIPGASIALPARLHMATLLHHIQPLMHRSITEAEEQIERKMTKHTKR